jgi:hypothetical protein
MLGPSGSFFQRMFNPSNMAQQMKRRVPPVGRAAPRGGTGKNVNLFGNKAPLPTAAPQAPDSTRMRMPPQEGGLQLNQSPITAPGGPMNRIKVPGRMMTY